MNPLFINFAPLDNKKKTLICFSFAGAGGNFFRQWAKYLLTHLNVIAIQLPGRETRYREPRVTSFVGVSDEIAASIDSEFSQDLVIYGHSMGGMLGFAVCQTLLKKQGRQVDTLFISGRRPPGYDPVNIEDIKTDSGLINFLKRMGGAPPGVLREADILELYLPIVRDDLVLNNKSSEFCFEAIDVPIVTFSGERDALAAPSDMALWYEFTTQTCSSHIFGGDHFFINEFREKMHSIMLDAIEVTGTA